MLAFPIVLILTFSVTLGVFLTFRYVWTRPSKPRNILINISTGLFSLILTLMILEGFFRVFVVSSDSFERLTLASRQWFAKYWNPINSFGYRDIEHDLNNLDGKKLLFVVGDSFVAGHGINNHRDRFSDVLGSQLKDDWEVFNIARNGWDTKDEFTAIRDFPVMPDAIVLSYFINDIDGTASRVWEQDQPSLIKQPHWLLRPMVKRSHLFNFFYWRVYRFRNSRQMATIYLSYLERAYNDANVWSVHEQDLLRIVDLANNNDIPLVVVVFPLLVDLDWSRPFEEKVVHLLRGRGVPVIHLSEKISGRDHRELVVNNLDAHPSVSLHAEVASLLRAQLTDKTNDLTH